MKYLFVIFLCTFSLSIIAQEKIQGRIINEQGIPIAYATIAIKNTSKGTISSDSGRFSLKIQKPGDTIYFSAIGYERAEAIVADLLEASEVTIVLKRRNVQLPEIIIEPLEPKKILAKVIEMQADNLPDLPFSYQAFFRQYHIEDNQPAFLVESALEIFTPPIQDRNQHKINEVVKINEIRRSNNYEKNGDVHDNHLMDLLKQNVYFYSKNTILNSKGWSYYEFKADYTDEPECSNCILIHYSPKIKKDARLVNGKIWVDLNTHAIIKVEEVTVANPDYSPSIHELHNRWQFIQGKLEIRYQEKNNKTFLESIHYSYAHLVSHEQLKYKTFQVEEHFDLYVEQINEHTILSEKNASIPSLYSFKYAYNPDFWQEYKMLQQFPLKKEVTLRFEERKPLQLQFTQNGR